jgi:hypothetical protein
VCVGCLYPLCAVKEDSAKWILWKATSDHHCKQKWWAND